MFFKERNDFFGQMVQSAYPISHSIAVVNSNHTAPKEFLERVKQPNIPSVLYNGELWEHLIPSRHLRMGINADEKAPFAVNKSNHPLSVDFHRSGPNVKSLRVLRLVIGVFPADRPHVRRFFTVMQS